MLKKIQKQFMNIQQEGVQEIALTGEGGDDCSACGKEVEHYPIGTAIETITRVTGIKTMVEGIASTLQIDCGCDRRKEKLNKLIRKD